MPQQRGGRQPKKGQNSEITLLSAGGSGVKAGKAQPESSFL